MAFAEKAELEQNALRALFRVYNDLKSLSNIRLKIFLRTDIWNKLAAKGFREASHITRGLTIEWNSSALLNLVIRRLLHNESLRRAYTVTHGEVLSSTETQTEFFYRVFPDQVEIGPNKSKTFDWLLSRTRDGSKKNAPRELTLCVYNK